jgi:sulfide:quinone oxidoreductase
MVLVDEHMRSLKYDNVFAIGIAVSLPKVEETPVATGAPKTGFMIESMGTCAADNIRAQVDAEVAGEDVHEASKEMPSLSALCITDFGDTGAVALAIPQFAPRRADLHIINPLVRLAKISFEQYFLYKVKTGDCDPYYEKWLLNLVGLKRLSDEHVAPEILKQDISPLPKRGTETAQRGFPEH